MQLNYYLINTWKLKFRKKSSNISSQVVHKIIRNFAGTTLLTLLVLFVIPGCEEFVEIDPPKTELVRSTVFQNESTATAALLGIYNQMITSTGFSSGSVSSISYLASISADDLDYVSTAAFNAERLQFFENQIVPANSIISSDIWGEAYQYIFKANAIIEGLANNDSNISDEVRQQLIGEAKFIRAFSYFYLVNLFGDVPLVLSTEFQANTSSSRIPEKEIYNQIISDLIEAQDMLKDDFSVSAGERTRPNNGTVTALLARVYLYNESWSEAESMSSLLINNTTNYNLVTDLDAVFLANSNEAIWQLNPNNGNGNSNNTWEGTVFPLTFLARISNSLYNAFEEGDARLEKWVGTDASGVAYFPLKYKLNQSSKPAGQEYSMVFRLSEQYLIRAESRAQLGNISGAQGDINMVRNRSGLSNTEANDLTSLLQAVRDERRVELFTEWGHRWLDLKRTSRANEVLGPQKSGWQPTDIFYPIPEIEIQNNPNLANSQNPGY